MPRPAVDEAHDGPPGDPDSVARLVCLKLLERRARTRSELATALAAKGVPDGVAGRVLDRFVEVGLIDDAALAENLARARHRGRGLSGRAIAAELRRRGVGDDDVQAAVEQIDPGSELEAARALVLKRLRSLGGLDPSAQARRLVGLLARKGYPSALAYRVVKEALATPELADALVEP